MKPAGQTVLVTGASRGIGRAIAVAFGGAGCRVVVNYAHNAAAAAETVAAVERAGGQACAVQADVRDCEAVRAMTAEAAARFGPVDVLVNNAGIARDTPVTFMTDAQWTEVLDVNLKGAFHAVKAVSKEMVRRRAGRIVNVSSDAGLLGDPMRANYSAAKAGLIGFTKAVARELAPYGVTVNAVAPGPVETEFIAAMNPASRQKQLALIPLRRFGEAREIADAVLFLASGQAAYITGEVLCVDGGLCMR